jgi:hypothetical protein
VLALPVALVGDPTAAWRASEQVDQDYARWAGDEDAKRHCTPLDYIDLGYVAAVGANYQATVDKVAALEPWNPIAGQFGLPAYGQGQIQAGKRLGRAHHPRPACQGSLPGWGC